MAAFLVVTVLGGWRLQWREHGLLGLVAYWTPVLLVLLAAWFARWMPFRRYAQNKMIQEPCTGTVSEAGIDWRTESTHSHPAWVKLLKAKLGDRLVLIYVSAIQVFPFPRNFFESEDDWLRFRALVQRKLPYTRR